MADVCFQWNLSKMVTVLGSAIFINEPASFATKAPKHCNLALESSPVKKKGKRKWNIVQNKTEGRNDVKVKTCMEDLHCWVHSSSYKRILKW